MNDFADIPTAYLRCLQNIYEGRASADAIIGQLTNEAELREKTITRFERQHQKAADTNTYSDTTIGRKAVAHLLRTFTEALEDGRQYFIGKRGPRHRALKLFESQPLEIEVIAHVTLRAAIDCLLTRQVQQVKKKGPNVSGVSTLSATSIEAAIGRRLYQEMEAAWARDAAFLSFQNFDEQRRKSRLGRAQAVRALHRRMESHEIEYRKASWDHRDKVAIGHWLLSYLAKSTGIIELSRNPVVKIAGGKSTDLQKVHYRFTDEFQEWIADAEARRALVEQFHWPMIVPPLPWSLDNLISGPYLHPATPHVAVIKNMREETFDELKKSQRFPQTLDALNAIQEVPYVINDYVHEALQWSWDRGDGTGKLPAAEDLEYPAWDEAWKGNKELTQAWVNEFHDVENANAKRQSNYLALNTALDTASRFAGQAIYFPHTMDSRGRIYPLSVYGVSPQGQSYQKALLKFAEGRPIESREQLEALYIHCATQGEYEGVDKAPLAERVGWVERNLEAIKAIGEDYRSNVGFWHDAEHPFTFLAACREIYEFHQVGFGYVSALPVYSDATCSGIQHYSALFRDEKGGHSVNLVPGYERQDIYELVAQDVVQAMERIKVDPSETELARQIAVLLLEHGLDRKATKRQCMTRPYNSKRHSCMNYTREWLKKQIAQGLTLPTGVNLRDVVSFLSPLIWNSIETTIPLACDAMRWIEGVTKQTVNANPTTPLQWDMSDGMVCLTKKCKTDEKRFTTTFEGKVVERRLRLDNEVQAPNLHGNAMPPNFIHSLDSLHARFTATAWEDQCYRQGRRPAFTFIHDSFGVPAADAPAFNQVIRDVFVALYTEHDHLQNWLNCMQEIAGKDVVFPAPPPMGSLNIEGVRQSEFFFS